MISYGTVCSRRTGGTTGRLPVSRRLPQQPGQVLASNLPFLRGGESGLQDRGDPGASGGVWEMGAEHQPVGATGVRELAVSVVSAEL